MPLRKGKTVESDQQAQQESTAHIELDVTDDAPAQGAQTEEPAPPASLNRATPPDPRPLEVVQEQPPEPSLSQQDLGQGQEAPTRQVPQVAVPSQVQPVQGGSNVPANVQDQLSAAGFEGLNFGFGSFPIITLQNNGMFESSEGGSFSDGFYCVLFSSVPKYIYKNNVTGKDEDFFYTYDDEYATDGVPVEEHIKAWQAKGWKFEKKPYLDVQAKLVTDDEDNDSMVLLSIPKTSIPRFSGYTATLLARGKLPQQVVTQISRGDKVTKVQYPFFPWSFKYYQDCS